MSQTIPSELYAAASDADARHTRSIILRQLDDLIHLARHLPDYHPLRSCYRQIEDIKEACEP